jgi:hypothetical protein
MIQWDSVHHKSPRICSLSPKISAIVVTFENVVASARVKGDGDAL